MSADRQAMHSPVMDRPAAESKEAGALQSGLLVARREASERLRSKAFIISNLFFLALLVIGAVLAGVLGSTSATKVGVVEGPASAIAAAAEAVGDATGAPLELVAFADGDAARAAVGDGEVEAALVAPTTLVVERSADEGLLRLLAGAEQQTRLAQALTDAGVAQGSVEGLLTPPEIEIDRLDPDPAPSGAALAVGAIAVAFLYFQLIQYGQYVAQGLVEEKSSRIIEVLLTSVRPRRLLAGKVLGLGGVGLLSVLSLGGVGYLTLRFSGAFDVPPEAYGTIAAVVGWYVLGYLLYACLFALGGALVHRVEDLQSAVIPAFALLIGSFFLAQYALQDPGGTAATVGALLPFSAPMLQPLLFAAGVLEPWEVIAGIGACVVTIALLVPIAARVYAGGALRTERLKLSEAWRSARA